MVVDNTFQICDLGTPYKIVGKQGFPADYRLSDVGFDDLYRPYQVVDIKHDNASAAPPTSVVWMD